MIGLIEAVYFMRLLTMQKSKSITRKAAKVGLIAVMMFSLTGVVWAYKGEKYANQAKITLEKAEKIALKIAPGNIKDKELELENGGSGLRYSFDILYKGKIHEVGVDAKTGKVLENSLPGPNPD
jgi:uncharacterized membrane protein YkoI